MFSPVSPWLHVESEYFFLTFFLSTVQISSHPLYIILRQLVNKMFSHAQRACSKSVNFDVVTLLLFRQAAAQACCCQPGSNLLRAGDIRLVETTCNWSNDVVNFVTR